jgi:hypothetical protein
MVREMLCIRGAYGVVEGIADAIVTMPPERLMTADGEPYPVKTIAAVNAADMAKSLPRARIRC